MNLSSARRILICLRYGIGDLVMGMPALDVLRRHSPQAQITALGARPAIQLLEGDRRVDRLFSVQDWGLRHWGDTGTPEVAQGIRSWLAGEDFDLVLDPAHAVRGVGEAIHDFRPKILESGGDVQMRALAEAGGGLAGIRTAVRTGWGIEVPESMAPQLRLRPPEREFASDFLRRNGLGPRPVGISPVASSSLKRWGLNHFAGLADQLTEESNSSVLLFTGPQRMIGQRLREAMFRPGAVLVGPLHLRRVAALLSACRLFVGNDTGLMHLAAAVGTPVVALFGPTSPDIYLPDHVPARALGGREDCSWRLDTFGPPECVRRRRCLAGLRSCIDVIDPAQVLAAARGLMAVDAKE